MGNTKIGMSRITAMINERGGVCCWTVYSLLTGYKSVPGLYEQVVGRYHLCITHTSFPSLINIDKTNRNTRTWVAI